MKRNESKQPLTDAEKLAKRQKRARHDIRTAWRNMTTEDRAEFLADLGLAWAEESVGARTREV